MATPRTKRQFAGASADPSQRQITSFFTTQSTGAVTNTADPSLRQPALPASVQANLLSVGMRVRKSVPEGYKTVGYSAFKLWTDNSRHSEVKIPATTVRSVSRELLPFCGINKVGGLDTQPEFVYDDDAGDVPALDEVPELTLSQESTDSAAASEPSRKRFYDDDEGSQNLNAPRLGAWDGEVSPRSLTPVGWGNSRVMAVPHSRVKKNPAPVKDVDQENASMDEDFEDAEFLVFGEKEMDLTA